MSPISTPTSRTGALLLPALLLACGLACSAGDGAYGPTEDTDTDAHPTDSDGDTDVAPFPTDGASWGLGGELLLVAHQPDPSGSSLALSARSPSGARCDVDAAIATVTEADAPVEGLYGWWALALAPGAEGDCDWPGPGSLALGVGPADPQLGPAAARLDVPLERAYGLYLQADGEPLLIGLATTPAGLDGTEPLATSAPLPDATYTLQTLFGLPL